jgi:formylglycine-generating enzyme required for sulfatase activity
MLGNLRVVGFGSAQRHDAVPAHPVAMEPFCLDATEMTVRRYQELGVDWPTDKQLPSETPYQPALGQACTWGHLAPHVQGADVFPLDAPMNCVDYVDATRACAKAGGRLPTEAEWEYVATGMGRGSLFPWGDEPPTCATVALARKSISPYVEATCGDEGVGPVRSFSNEQGGIDEIRVAGRGNPADAIFDLGGSVSEWVLDTFTSYTETSESINCWQIEGVRWHPSCEVAGTSMSVRGGNFIDEPELSYSALRWNEQQPTHAEAIGFRCAYPLGDRDPKRPRSPVSNDPGPQQPPDDGVPGSEGRP